MLPSNILNVFNQNTESRVIGDDELCLECQLLGTLTSLVGGACFISNLPFKGENPAKNPTWWKNSVKSAGVVLVGLGIYRGTEGWLWNTDVKYKSSIFK